MLDLLHKFESDLPDYLAWGKWNSLYINYHEPFVQRLWMPYSEGRAYLHKIMPVRPGYPSLFHNHSWPSAIKVLAGKYEMEVGHIKYRDSSYDDGSYDVEPANQVIDLHMISHGIMEYEMLDRRGFHSVRPIDEPSYSIMITGRPWHKEEYKGPKLEPLNDVDKNGLLTWFKNYYPQDSVGGSQRPAS